MRALLELVVLFCVVHVGKAATNGVFPFRTNFVHGADLSFNELASVTKLATACGISNITEVSTELHLSGTTIRVAGDEKFEGRSVIFKTLLICVNNSRRARPADAPSVGEFWAPSGLPGQEERTIVKIRDREVRVGLLNGIKPAGADKILEAFEKGRIRVPDEALKDALSEVDMLQPSWIGIEGGKLSITFASRPLTTFIFTMNGDEITLVDRIRRYE